MDMKRMIFHSTDMKVSKAKTVKLVDAAIKFASMHPQYSEPWIVFDKDQVENFD